VKEGFAIAGKASVMFIQLESIAIALSLSQRDRSHNLGWVFVGCWAHVNNWAHVDHWCQFKVGWAVKTAAIQTKPACAGFKILNISLVRAGGLGFYSRVSVHFIRLGLS